MVKKTRAKRRGISRGVQKHKIRLPAFGNGGNPLVLPERYLNIIRLAARICWAYLGIACWILFLIPLERRRDGSFEIGSRFRRTCHYGIICIGVALMIYKFWSMANRIIFEDLDILTYICASAFLLYFVAAAGTIGTTWTFREMEEMTRSWDPNLEYLEEVTGQRVTLFDSISVCIKIIGITLGSQAAAFDAALLSLFFDELPGTVFYTLKHLAIIPENSWSTLAWQLVLFPIELPTTLAPTYIGALSISVGVLGLGLLRTYVDKMKAMSTRNMDGWNRLELVYRCMRVYNTIFMNWLKYFLMPLIFSLCTGATVLFYVSLRPSGLPNVVYIWFPFVAIVILGILSWLWFDVVMLKRVGDEVLEDLQCRKPRLCIAMDLEERKLFVRRGRSHRLVFVSIGEFAEITMEGLMGVWEEVFNQLLFLLTL